MVANVEIPTATALSGVVFFHYIYTAECIRWHDLDCIRWTPCHLHTRHTHTHTHEEKREKEKRLYRGRIPTAMDRTRTRDPICAPGSFSLIYIKSLTNAHAHKRSLTNAGYPKRPPTPMKTVVTARKYTP